MHQSNKYMSSHLNFLAFDQNLEISEIVVIIGDSLNFIQNMRRGVSSSFKRLAFLNS